MPRGPRYLLGDRVSVLDLYVAVVSRWQPRRLRFYREAPRMAEVVRRVDAEPRLLDQLGGPLSLRAALGKRGPIAGRPSVGGGPFIEEVDRARARGPLILRRNHVNFSPTGAEDGRRSKETGLDRKLISLSEPHEVQSWTQSLGCTAEQLKEAVGAVGDSAEALRAYLKKK